MSVANLTSLLVKIPRSLLFVSTTGIPEISFCFIRSRASDKFFSGEIVTGSITIPVSNFLTLDTF